MNWLVFILSLLFAVSPCAAESQNHCFGGTAASNTVMTTVIIGGLELPAAWAYDVDIPIATTGSETAQIVTVQARNGYDAVPVSSFRIGTPPRGPPPGFEEFLAAEGGGFGAIGLNKLPNGPVSGELEALYLQRASSPVFQAKLWAHNQLAGLLGARSVSAAEITDALANTEFREASLFRSTVNQTSDGFIIGGTTRGGYFAGEIADHELLHIGQFLRTPGINTGIDGMLMHEPIPAFLGSPVVYGGGTAAIFGGAYGVYRATGGGE